jgi:TATA-binding protein-associated factor Taf7
MMDRAFVEVRGSYFKRAILPHVYAVRSKHFQRDDDGVDIDHLSRCVAKVLAAVGEDGEVLASSIITV